MKLVAGNRLGAPVASIRTSAAGDHVQREISVRLSPSVAVGMRCRSDRAPARADAIQPADFARGVGPRFVQLLRTSRLITPGTSRGILPAAASAAQSSASVYLGFADQDEICSVLQIFFRMISGVGAVRRSRSRQPSRAASIICQATSRMRVRHILERKLKSSS